ncbi:MAG: nitrate/nitrite transporter NrtS [Pseudomonadota bacterium]
MHAALERETVIRSLKVALIVGTALNLINQGDAVMNSEPINIFKCLLTYAVPYCVATYGAVAALRARKDRSD